MDWDFPDKNTGVGCHFIFPGEANTSICVQLTYYSEKTQYLAGGFFQVCFWATVVVLDKIGHES